MRSLSRCLEGLTGWRGGVLAALCGLLAATAQPPFSIVPAIFLGFAGLVLLLDGAAARHTDLPSRCRAAFRIGWAFALGYFLLGFYWIGEAFLVEAATYAWMMPFAVLLLPAAMAIYWGLACALAVCLWSRGWPRLIVLAVFATAGEWLRGHLFTGFPWSLPGYVLGFSDALSQSAALVGAYGLTFIVLAIAGTPALIVDWLEQEPARRRFPVIPLLVALLVIAAMWAGGAYRLHESPGEPDQSAPRLRIVQPNIEQGEKWRPEHAPAILNQFLELSTARPSTYPEGLDAIDYLIWPESALPFLIDERADIRGVLGAILPTNVTLITGGIRREPDPANPRAQGDFYNSLQVIDHTGDVRAAYDKWHLVPFGEYLPFESWLQPLGFRQLVPLPASFSSGSGPRTLGTELGLRPFSPLICYEVIFPSAVVSPTGQRPQWLLNVTNDAWFGQSAGPYQHLMQARFRAIEEGLPLVRAANTGISAIIDAQGRIRESIPLAEKGLIDARLPSPASPPPYARFGDALVLILALAALLVALLRRNRHPLAAY